MLILLNHLTRNIKNAKGFQSMYMEKDYKTKGS